MAAQAPSYHFGSLARGGGGRPQPPPSTYAQGIDFRQAASYVADPSGYDVETSIVANYPRTTPQGNVVGWEHHITGVRDRSKSVDPRLAGVAFIEASLASVSAAYRLDVKAGTYAVRLALGDATTRQAVSMAIYDDINLLQVVARNVVLAGGMFVDATGAVMPAEAWPDENRPTEVTVKSGALRFVLSHGAADAASSTIASLHVASV